MEELLPHTAQNKTRLARANGRLDVVTYVHRNSDSSSSVLTVDRDNRRATVHTKTESSQLKSKRRKIYRPLRMKSNSSSRATSLRRGMPFESLLKQKKLVEQHWND